MKSRKSHIPHTILRKLGRSDVPQRKQNDGSGPARLTRLFADHIIGKYGFWRQDYFGRLSLVFRESAGADGEEQDDDSAKWRQMVEQLQAQLAALKHSRVQHIVTRTETIHRLERLIHYYSGMAGAARKKQAPIRLEPSAAAASKSQQRSITMVARGRQTAASNASTTGKAQVSSAGLAPNAASKLTMRDARKTAGSKKQIQQAERPGQTHQQVVNHTNYEGKVLVNRRETQLDQPQAAERVQAFEQRQGPDVGPAEQRQLATPNRVPAQEPGMPNEGSSGSVQQKKLKEGLREEHSDRDQQQAAQVKQDHFASGKLAVSSDKLFEQRNQQVTNHDSIDPIKDAVRNVSAPSQTADQSVSPTITRGVARWVSDNSKLRRKPTLQSQSQEISLYKHGLKQVSTLPHRPQTMTGQIGYLQHLTSRTSASPTVWRTNEGVTGNTSSFTAKVQQLQQQETSGQPSSASMGQSIAYQARRDKEHQTDMIQRQFEYMLPPGHRQAAQSRLTMTSQARLPEQIRRSGDMQHPFSSVDQPSHRARDYKTSLTQSLKSVDRYQSFFDHDNHAGERWIGESLRHQGSTASRSSITQMETPFSQLAHTVNLISRLSATHPLRIDQSDSWNPELYKQHPIHKPIPQSDRRTLSQIENGIDHTSRNSTGITATYRELPVQRRRETSEMLLNAREHANEREARYHLNSANQAKQLLPDQVRQAGRYQHIFKPSDIYSLRSEYQAPSPLPPLSLMLQKVWQPAVIDSKHERNVWTQLSRKPMTAPSYLQVNDKKSMTQDYKFNLQRSPVTGEAESKRMTASSYLLKNDKRSISQDYRSNRQRSSVTGEADSKRMTAPSFLQTTSGQLLDKDKRFIVQPNSGTALSQAASVNRLARASMVGDQSSAMVVGSATLSGFNGNAWRSASSSNPSFVESALRLLPVLTDYGKRHWIGADHRQIQPRYDGNSTEQMERGYRSRGGQALKNTIEPITGIRSGSNSAKWGEFVHKTVVPLDRASTAPRLGNTNPVERSLIPRGNRASELSITGQQLTSQALVRNRAASQAGSASPIILAATLQSLSRLAELSKESYPNAKLALRSNLKTPDDKAGNFNQPAQARRKQNKGIVSAGISAPIDWIQHWSPLSGSNLPDLFKVRAQIGDAFRSRLVQRSGEPVSLQRTAISVGDKPKQMPANRSNQGVTSLASPAINKQAIFAEAGSVSRKSSKSITGFSSGSMARSMMISGISGPVPSLVLRSASKSTPESSSITRSLSAPESRSMFPSSLSISSSLSRTTSRSISRSVFSDSPIVQAYLPKPVLNGEAGSSIQPNRFTTSNSAFAQAPLLERSLVRAATNEIRSLKAPSMAVNDFYINQSNKPALRSYITRDAAEATSSFALKAASSEGKVNPALRFIAAPTRRQSLADSIGNRPRISHPDMAAPHALYGIRNRSQDSPMRETNRSRLLSPSTIQQSREAMPVSSGSAGIGKEKRISAGFVHGDQGSSLLLSGLRSGLQGQGNAGLRSSTLQWPILQGSTTWMSNLQSSAIQRLTKEKHYDHAAEVILRTNGLSSEMQRRLPPASRTVTVNPDQKDANEEMSTATRFHISGALQWQQEVRSDLSITNQAKQRMHGNKTVTQAVTAEENGNKPGLDGLKGRSVLVSKLDGSSARDLSVAGFGKAAAIRMLRRTASPPVPDPILGQSGTAGITNQPRHGTKDRNPILSTNSSPQLSLKRISQVMPQASYSRSVQPTGSRSKEGLVLDNQQKIAVPFQSKPRSLAQAPISVRPYKREDASDPSGKHRVNNSGMVAAPADIFTYSQQPSTALGLAGAQLEHKQQTTESSKSEEMQPLNLELLRRQRQQEPEETLEVIQSQEPLELTKEQINDLIKQIPQLDVNHLVDKVTRELEKRMRFERQRRGR